MHMKTLGKIYALSIENGDNDKLNLNTTMAPKWKPQDQTTRKQHSFLKQWVDGLRFRIDARTFILMIWMEIVDDALVPINFIQLFSWQRLHKDTSWPYRTSLAEDEIWPQITQNKGCFQQEYSISKVLKLIGSSNAFAHPRWRSVWHLGKLCISTRGLESSLRSY